MLILARTRGIFPRGWVGEIFNRGVHSVGALIARNIPGMFMCVYACIRACPQSIYSHTHTLI